MPLLTADNLTDFARAARYHLYGHDRKPLGLADLANCRRILGREVTGWVFGPEAGRYSSLFGVGIYDLNGVKANAGLSERELVTIEQTFEHYLAKYPPAEGFDVVVILHERPINTLIELARLDGDGEVCAKKVWDARASRPK